LPTSRGTSDAESLIGASIPKNYKISDWDVGFAVSNFILSGCKTMSLKDNSEPSAAVQPAATFEDVKSNKKLIRKIDFHVLPCLALLYLVSQVHSPAC
jgi:hypothetical protein